MQEFNFEIQGSAEAPYQVKFVARDGELYGTCTCAAGEQGQACKHRSAILDGDVTAVVSGADYAVTLAGLLPGTKLQTAIQAIAGAEEDLARAKKAVAAAKKQLGRVMLPPTV
ncbi:hypothetical protein [Cupriavidus pauculus]|uniref:hypothetical protein n=1 Tax=Cupriavidus pauculus TaxID=82633 RepID=UPI0011AF2EB4|nr:hypothetical protein [Cupriavidus pauculus]